MVCKLPSLAKVGVGENKQKLKLLNYFLIIKAHVAKKKKKKTLNITIVYV